MTKENVPKTRKKTVGIPSKKRAGKEPDTTPDTNGANPLEEVTAALRDTLEYEICGRDACMTVAGKRITISKWGLRKNLQYGGRVLNIFQRIQALIPQEGEGTASMMQDAGIVSQVLSYVSEDVLDVIAGSITDPFATHAEAIDWLDANASVEELFAMGHTIYELNFQGEKGLGKQVASLGELVSRIGGKAKTH